MSIVSLDQCNSSFSLPNPQLCGSHTHTHHFPSLISGTYFDCYYHVDDDALCDKGVCGPSSFSMQLITQKQANCHYWLLGSIIISYFSNPSTWRAPKLWQWGAPHWLVGSHEIFFRVLLPNGSWIHSHFTHVSSFVGCSSCMNRMGDACS